MCREDRLLRVPMKAAQQRRRSVVRPSGSAGLSSGTFRNRTRLLDAARLIQAPAAVAVSGQGNDGTVAMRPDGRDRRATGALMPLIRLAGCSSTGALAPARTGWLPAVYLTLITESGLARP